MNFAPATMSAFLDELEKIASSHGRMRIPKSRAGRRSMRVDTLLKKDKAGTLYKEADSMGNPQDVRGAGADDPGAAKLPHRKGETPSKEPNLPQEAKTGGAPYADPTPVPLGETPPLPPEPKKPRKKGEVPSLDDVNSVDRYDQRDFATTVNGPSQHSSGIGATNHPSEHA